MLPAMETMFQRCFRAVSMGVCPYRQKSDLLSISFHEPAIESAPPFRVGRMGRGQCVVDKEPVR